MLVVPFLGLTVATAPGFAHFLGFLKPLARSDGFGSGVAEGLAPALALILTTCLAVFATDRELPWALWRASSDPPQDSQSRSSWSRGLDSRFSQFKSTFYLLVSFLDSGDDMQLT